MKSAIKKLVSTLPTPLVYHIHRAAHKMSGVQSNSRHVAYLEKWPDPPVVVAGPFKGMVFTRRTFSSSLVPSLLGTYELEIHGAVEALCAYQPDVLADIGAGEGYYAVGMLLRVPALTSVGFEMFKPANHILGRVAKVNGVQKRLIRPGVCTPAKLQMVLESAKRPAVLCDCEGAEDFLLNPNSVPALTRSAILVELHDHERAGVSERIRERFTGSHTIEVFTTRGRSAEDLPAGYTMTDEQIEELLVEHRKVQQSFYWMVPKQA